MLDDFPGNQKHDYVFSFVLDEASNYICLIDALWTNIFLKYVMHLLSEIHLYTQIEDDLLG